MYRFLTQVRLGVTAFAIAIVPAVSPSAATPKVVATIAPIHSLVSTVMKRVGSPVLLLPSGVSPHSYALKPSDARKLASADVIVTVGPALESFLQKPLGHLARKARVVTLTRDAGIKLLIATDDHHDDHGHGHHHGDDHKGVNPHIWLDPINAMRIVGHVADVLAEIDPDNRQRYRSNATHAIADLRKLDQSLGRKLVKVRKASFMVSHDAFAYFVARYRLRMAGVFHRTPEQAPGAKHIATLRTKLKKQGVRCVFSEPQFTSKTVTASLNWAGVRAAVLDPIGLDIEPGPAAYEILMRRLASTLAECLAAR